MYFFLTVSLERINYCDFKGIGFEERYQLKMAAT